MLYLNNCVTEFCRSLNERPGDGGWESNLVIAMPTRSDYIKVKTPYPRYQRVDGKEVEHSLVGYSHSAPTLYEYLFGRILNLCSHGYGHNEMYDEANPIHELLATAARRPGGIEGVVIKQHRAWNGAEMFRTSDEYNPIPPRPVITLWIERSSMREGVDYDFSDQSGVPRLNSRLMFHEKVVPKLGIKGKRFVPKVSPYDVKDDVEGWYCNTCSECGDWIEWRKGTIWTLHLEAHCPSCSAKASSLPSKQQEQRHQSSATT